MKKVSPMFPHTRYAYMGEICGGSCNVQASGNLVAVDILELGVGSLPHQQMTGAADDEGNRPEPDTGNG